MEMDVLGEEMDVLGEEMDVRGEEMDMLEREMCTLQECLAQRSAESQMQREMLRRLTKKQEQLNESITQLSTETSVTVQRFKNCRQECQQLERMLGRCRKQCQAIQEASRKHEEAQQRAKLYAEAGAFVQREKEAMRREISKLKEEIDYLAACQLQRKKESEIHQTARPELVEAERERDSLARRCGFMYWLQTLCMLFTSPKFAIIFILAAAVLCVSWSGLELFYYLLLHVLREETYTNVAYAVGRILPVVSEGPLPL